MLSIGKIKLSGEGYYLDAVADGIDEYYRGVGEAPGRWIGRSASESDFCGKIGLTWVNRARRPTNGDTRRRGIGDKKTRREKISRWVLCQTCSLHRNLKNNL